MMIFMVCNMKICSKCKEEKDISSFNKKRASKDGHRAECKECQKISNKKYKTENREKLKDKNKEYYENNKERIKEYYKDYSQIYFQKNKERINEYRRDRRKKDISYDISCRTRTRIGTAIKNKSNSTKELLGCDIDFYIQYLEEKFEEGMTWENRDEWHIDHIIPIASFDLTDEKQLFEAFHYTNTQPLWAEDNFRKGGGL